MVYQIHSIKKWNTIISKYKLDYIFIFGVILFLEVFCRSEISELRMLSDDIGMLISPATLAGFDWKEVSCLSYYYGPGYYVFLMPLFKVISNPIILYNIIINLNFIINALSGVLLQYFICNILGYKQRGISAFVVVFSINAAWKEAGSGLSNESQILILMVLILICLSKMYLCESKKKYLYMFLTFILLAYSITIHSRNIVFVVSMFFIVIFMRLKKHGSKGLCAIVLIAVIAIFLEYRYVPSWIARLLFPASSETGALANVSIGISGDVIKNGFSAIKDILFIFVGNVYASVVRTYGIILVGYYMTFKVLVNILRRKEKGNLFTYIFDNSDIAEGMFMFSFLCYIIGLVGLSISWAGLPRGSGYWRYYGTYTSFYIACSFIYVLEDRSCDIMSGIKRYLISGIILIKSFLVLVLPGVLNTEYIQVWFTYNGLIQRSNNVSWQLTMVLTMFAVLILIIPKKYIKLSFIIVLFLFSRIKYGETGGNIFTYTYNNKCDSGYRVNELGKLDQEYNIYFYGSDASYIVYQYMFLEKNITRNIPDDAENIIIFSDQPSLTTSSITTDDFYRVQLDWNEFIYTDSNDIYNEVTNIVSSLYERGAVYDSD